MKSAGRLPAPDLAGHLPGELPCKISMCVYLYEAARLGSMRAAADQLGVAVSSISRQISQLEAELGVALIEHGRRSLLLTEAGKLLIDYYSEQLTHRESFEARLADLKGLRTGRLSLAIGEGFIGTQLAGVGRALRLQTPGNSPGYPGDGLLERSRAAGTGGRSPTWAWPFRPRTIRAFECSPLCAILCAPSCVPRTHWRKSRA